jgi:cell division protein ZapA
MARPVEVRILGQRLTVASDDGEQHVRDVAAYVDHCMRRLAADAPATSSLDLALVTALNIASEWRKLQNQQQELSQTINRLTRRVTATLARLEAPVRKGESIARR